ncbi:hypothetical protein BGX21_004834, partial [Mortierella sp. AD011]
MDLDKEKKRVTPLTLCCIGVFSGSPYMSKRSSKEAMPSSILLTISFESITAKSLISPVPNAIPLSPLEKQSQKVMATRNRIGS